VKRQEIANLPHPIRRRRHHRIKVTRNVLLSVQPFPQCASASRTMPSVFRVCGGLAAIGCFGVLGWVLDVEVLKVPFRGGLKMKMSAIVHSDSRNPRRQRWRRFWRSRSVTFSSLACARLRSRHHAAVRAPQQATEPLAPHGLPVSAVLSRLRWGGWAAISLVSEPTFVRHRILFAAIATRYRSLIAASSNRIATSA
jgi:hypothetical protein